MCPPPIIGMVTYGAATVRVFGGEHAVSAFIGRQDSVLESLGILALCVSNGRVPHVGIADCGIGPFGNRLAPCLYVYGVIVTRVGFAAFMT